MLLYTVGDSFTAGEELAEPHKTAWPAVLADKLGYDVINRGKSGAGNEYMSTCVVGDSAKYQPDLVIVAWTSCGRQEFSDENGVWYTWPGYTYHHFSSGHPFGYRKAQSKYLARHHNSAHQFGRWLKNIILLQSYLKHNNIPYLFVNALPYNRTEMVTYGSEYNHLVDQVDQKNFYGWPDLCFQDIYYGCKIGKNGHPLERGHQLIAKKLHSILDR